MDELTRLLLAGAFAFCSFTLEGITGFGSTVIALPFVAMLLGIKMTVPFLCVLSTLLSLSIVINSWRLFKWKEYLFITIHVGLGLPLGIWMFNRLPADVLCFVLSCVMIAVGIQGAVKTAEKRQNTMPAAAPAKNFFMRLILFAGGVIHGAFGTGGPLVVIYASRALPEKGLFRITLTMLWLTMNFIRIAEWIWQGTICTKQMGKAFLIGLPFVIAGIVLGEILHHRVNDHYFKLCVYGVLILAGVVMFTSNGIKLCI